MMEMVKVEDGRGGERYGWKFEGRKLNGNFKDLDEGEGQVVLEGTLWIILWGALCGQEGLC